MRIRKVIDMRTGLAHFIRSPHNGRYITRALAAEEAQAEDVLFSRFSPALLRRYIWKRQAYEQ